jgi:hypothetical protein
MGKVNWLEAGEGLMATSKTKLLAELKLTPIIQVACKKANIGRATYYRWRKEDLGFAASADEALELAQL